MDESYISNIYKGDSFGEKSYILLKYPSSSSFIEPPATGHHRWSGAKKTFFNQTSSLAC
jgi:hypothetical protein